MGKTNFQNNIIFFGGDANAGQGLQGGYLLTGVNTPKNLIITLFGNGPKYVCIKLP